MSEQDEIITGKQAAEILKCSVAYLYDLIDANVLERVPQRTLMGSNRMPLRFRRSQVMKVARDTGRLDDKESSLSQIPA